MMSFRFGTFSIVGCCPRTKQLGVATCTAAFAVGAFVPHARAHIGAVATQAFTNPYLGLQSLDGLEKGMMPQDVITQVIAGDQGRELRQLAMVDVQGRSAAHTGKENDHWAGHLTGPFFAAAGNILTGPEVVEAMVEVFQSGVSQPLGERLMRSLEAGERVGGDRRGTQSAVMYVVGDEDYGYVDLRVDDHADPISELRRLWQIYQKDLEPAMSLFPSKANPAGELDRAVWLGTKSTPGDRG